MQTKIDATAQKDSNMNNNSIVNLGPPFELSDATNKEYVDEYFLRRDGSQPLYGDLNMWQQRITALHGPTDNTDAASKNYVDNTLKDFLKRDGSQAMTGNLNKGDHKIIALEKPVNETDAATKGYADHLHLSQSGGQKNQGRRGLKRIWI